MVRAVDSRLDEWGRDTDSLRIQISETGRRVDSFLLQLQGLEARRAFAKCQACYDTRKVPLDGYLDEEVQDHRNYQRPCTLCFEEKPPSVNKRFADAPSLWEVLLKFNALLHAGLLIWPTSAGRITPLFGLILTAYGLFALRLKAKS